MAHLDREKWDWLAEEELSDEELDEIIREMEARNERSKTIQDRFV